MFNFKLNSFWSRVRDKLYIEKKEADLICAMLGKEIKIEYYIINCQKLQKKIKM